MFCFAPPPPPLWYRLIKLSTFNRGDLSDFVFQTFRWWSIRMVFNQHDFALTETPPPPTPPCISYLGNRVKVFDWHDVSFSLIWRYLFIWWGRSMFSNSCTLPCFEWQARQWNCTAVGKVLSNEVMLLLFASCCHLFGRKCWRTVFNT